MDMLALAVEDFNIFVKNTLVEEYYITRGSDSLSVECLSTTSMHSISNEGFIDWAKDKLSKLGRRFVVLVNKVVARFSKNREKLEENIKLYKENPNAEVVLAVSPKTIKVVSLVTAAVTAGIVSMVLCIPRKDGGARITQIYKGLKDRIAKAIDLIRRDKAAKGHSAKASEAAAASEEAARGNKKAEDTVKQAGSKVNGALPGSNASAAKGYITNAANATHKIADMTKDVARLQDLTSRRPLSIGHNVPKLLTDASRPAVADLEKLANQKMEKMRESVAEIVKDMAPANREERSNSKFMKLSRRYTRLVNRAFERAKKSTASEASAGKEDSKLNILNTVADTHDLLRKYHNEFISETDAL